jgi:hypothetical protein
VVSQPRLTVDQYTVRERVHSPDIWCPVSMAKASREWEKSLQDLWYLVVVHEWSECKSGNHTDAHAQFDAVEDLDIKDGARSKAIRPQ